MHVFSVTEVSVSASAQSQSVCCALTQVTALTTPDSGRVTDTDGSSCVYCRLCPLIKPGHVKFLSAVRDVSLEDL